MWSWGREKKLCDEREKCNENNETVAVEDGSDGAVKVEDENALEADKNAQENDEKCCKGLTNHY